jgi:hypothetical protein
MCVRENISHTKIHRQMVGDKWGIDGGERDTQKKRGQ